MKSDLTLHRNHTNKDVCYDNQRIKLNDSLYIPSCYMSRERPLDVESRQASCETRTQRRNLH